MSRPANVHLLELPRVAGGITDLTAITGRLGDLTTRVLGSAAGDPGTWALKIQLGTPGRVAAVAPEWSAAVAGALGGGRSDVFTCDTLSVTTRGMETAAGQREQATAKGYDPAGSAPRYLVADDPEGDASPLVAVEDEGELGEVGLAALTAPVAGLAVVTPVRPHPHAGFLGALTSLGLGLVDRETKLRIHQDIRPTVDTPLCAGCGSCLEVCIFDAIDISSGRARIDHQKCTGCGECMNVCFMAGIAAEDAAGIPRFQAKVAVAARAARQGTLEALRPAVYLNLLMRPDRSARGPKRQREPLGDVGVLAATDPVALDRATWDLIAQRSGGSLQGWSGFLQEPGPLLERAATEGLGRPDYRLLRI